MGTPRFVIFSSYGNDSAALIWWAWEQRLDDVHVVYTDTQWASAEWAARVSRLEAWTRALGFHTHRTTSEGFAALAERKKGFPTQQFQWCSYILKIEPGEKWLAENDPDRRAVCLVGVRREESQERATFPRFLLNSGNHGGRVMVAPFADFTEAERDDVLRRGGLEPLPHRSMECSPCVNSNRADIRALPPERVAEVRAVEQRMTTLFGMTKNGKPRTIFRPHRHMGAVGIDEVKRWADSERGKFVPQTPDPDATEDLPPEKDEWNCNNGYCSN